MSNDVHLARVSKIQRSSDLSKEFGNGFGLQDGGRRCKSGRNICATVKEMPPLDHSYEDSNCLESPHDAQRDTNESDNNISSCSTLDIVNKVENCSAHELEIKVRELSEHLQQVEEDRIELQQQLVECTAEKEHAIRRLDVISAAHECRITEMHCVIAELSKKLRAKQDSIIPEEQEIEMEGSEISYQESSVYKSELNLTNRDGSETERFNQNEKCFGDENEYIYEDNNIKNNVEFEFCGNKGQIEALQEEILHLKAQVALLQSEIANSNDVVVINDDLKPKKLDSFEDDKQFGDDSKEIEENENVDVVSADNLSIFSIYCDNEEYALNNFNSLGKYGQMASPQKIPPISAKVAERIKLRNADRDLSIYKKTVDECALHNTETNDLGGVEQSRLGLNESNNYIMTGLMESKDVNNEINRLERKLEHLKMENKVLSLTLMECKEHNEHLYLLCGKYESNAIALQTALNCSDRAIEAYDVMLALLESKMAMNNDRSSVCGLENHKAVESVARHLLERLESEKNICENSLGPWQNLFSMPEQVQNLAPWTSDDDSRLRFHVSKLKGRRAIVQNTIVKLESPFSHFHERSGMGLADRKLIPKEEKSVRHVDIELAVVMQELLNLKDEIITTKAKADNAECEKKFALDRVTLLQEALKQLQIQYTTDNPVIPKQSNLNLYTPNIEEKRMSSFSDAEHIAITEQQLVEALTRESELKVRLQTLIASVSASQKISDDKYEQLHNSVRDLQKSNLSLVHLLEQNKRKYYARMKRLEQKIVNMSIEQSSTETKNVCETNPR